MMKSSVESVKVEKQIKEYKEKNWLFILQLVIFILTVGSFVYTNLIVLKYQYISDFLIAVMLGIIAYNTPLTVAIREYRVAAVQSIKMVM